MSIRRILLVATVLIAVVGLAWFYTTQMNQPISKPAGGPKSGADAAVVAGVIVTRPFTEVVTLTGSVVADQSVELKSEIGGRITKLLFVEGAQVTRGQLLVKLSDADLVARREKLTQQLVLDKNRKARLEKLRATDGASLDEFESATAQVAMRIAEIAEIDAQIERTEVRAPFGGRIGLRSVSVGAVINPQTVIATLTSDNVLNVDCSVPERYVQSVNAGTSLRFRVRGVDTTYYTARVIAVESALDTRTRTQRVRARISNAANVKAGMYADVELQLAQHAAAILIPTSAVVQDMKGASVFRIEGGVARSAPVVLGSRTPKEVLVPVGLRAGDTIITSGVLFVKNGKPVRAVVQ